jgi:hypothetical protein
MTKTRHESVFVEREIDQLILSHSQYPPLLPSDRQNGSDISSKHTSQLRKIIKIMNQ